MRGAAAQKMQLTFCERLQDSDVRWGVVSGWLKQPLQSAPVHRHWHFACELRGSLDAVAIMSGRPTGACISTDAIQPFTHGSHSQGV